MGDVHREFRDDSVSPAAELRRLTGGEQKMRRIDQVEKDKKAGTAFSFMQLTHEQMVEFLNRQAR